MEGYDLNHPLRAGNADSGYMSMQKKIGDFYDSPWYRERMRRKMLAAGIRQAERYAEEDRRKIAEEAPGYAEKEAAERIMEVPTAVGAGIGAIGGTILDVAEGGDDPMFGLAAGAMGGLAGLTIGTLLNSVGLPKALAPLLVKKYLEEAEIQGNLPEYLK